MHMEDLISVFVENIDRTVEVRLGTSLLEISEQIGEKGKYPFLAAYVDNRVKELNYRVYTPISIRFIDISHFEGYRVNQRTLTFILQMAIENLYRECRLYVRNGMGDGVYCEIGGMGRIDERICRDIKAEMQGIIDSDFTIERRKVLTMALIEGFRQRGYEDKVALLKTRKSLYNDVWIMGRCYGLFFGALAPRTSYASMFDVKPYGDGMCLTLPAWSDPSQLGRMVKAEKANSIFRGYQAWVDIMGVPTVGALNARIQAGDASELIKIAEAFQEKRLSQVADMIQEANSSRGVKMVLISGPSSSGKTTTAKRIGIQLRVLGLHPVLISLDDYFVNREDTPKDENGEYDYEALEAIDIAQLNDHLKRLAKGESVAIPRYDFISGTRQWHENPLKLDEKSILILEGIHGLNPKLTPSIPDNEKFKIFISCFTSVSMDDISMIYTTDNRMLRRMTRDYFTRGNNAYDTISRWPSVRKGEEKHIWPYSENADVMLNSSLFYEISVLRPIVEPILREIPDSVPEFGEADRLLKFLSNFTPIKPDEIPPTSVLREFIGGSSFKY